MVLRQTTKGLESGGGGTCRWAPKKGHHRRQCEMTRISEIVRNGKSATAVDARVYDQLARQSNPPHWRPETVVSAVPHKMLLGGQFRKIVNS